MDFKVAFWYDFRMVFELVFGVVFEMVFGVLLWLICGWFLGWFWGRGLGWDFGLFSSCKPVLFFLEVLLGPTASRMGLPIKTFFFWFDSGWFGVTFSSEVSSCFQGGFEKVFCLFFELLFLVSG